MTNNYLEFIDDYCERLNDSIYALVYLRPDGWWIAGTGWQSEESAKEDANFPSHTTYRVVTLPEAIRMVLGEIDDEGS